MFLGGAHAAQRNSLLGCYIDNRRINSRGSSPFVSFTPCLLRRHWSAREKTAPANGAASAEPLVQGAVKGLRAYGPALSQANAMMRRPCFAHTISRPVKKKSDIAGGGVAMHL